MTTTEAVNWFPTNKSRDGRIKNAPTIDGCILRVKRGNESKYAAGELEEVSLYETKMLSLRPVLNQELGI